MDIILQEQEKVYGIIYCATNKINNKVYIGQTKQKLSTRIKQHIQSAKVTTSNIHFHNAINHYGIENFEWSIIDSANTLEELNNREVYWIDLLDSLNSGYNMTSGGDNYILVGLAKIHHQDAMLKRSECDDWQTQHKDMLNKRTQSKSWQDNHKKVLSDLHASPIHRAKMISGIREALNKKVVCLETEQIFDSQIQASKHFKIDPNSISACIKGKVLSACNLHFIRYEDHIIYDSAYCNQLIKVIESKRIDRRLSIRCIETQVVYMSIGQAAKELNIDSGSLSACLKGRHKTIGQLHWEYYNN